MIERKLPAISLMAVSYTHLDVYKRQGLHQHQRRRELDGGRRERGDEAGKDAAGHQRHDEDVYKRQLKRFSAHLSVLRNQPLTTRRYMWKVAY